MAIKQPTIAPSPRTKGKPRNPSKHPIRRWSRIGGLLGVLFVLLFVAGNALQGEGAVYDAGAGDIAAHYQEHTTQIFIGAQLVGASGLALLGFTAALAARARSLAADATSGFVLTGGGLAAGLLLMGAATQVAAVWGTAAQEPAAVAALFFVRQGLLNAFGLSLALLLGAIAFAAIRHAVVPRPLGWAAGVLAVAALVLPDRTIPVMATLLWSIVTGVFLIVRPGLPAPRAATTIGQTVKDGIHRIPGTAAQATTAAPPRTAPSAPGRPRT